MDVQVSGTIPSSGKLRYSNNVLNAGCLVIGDYKVTFGTDGKVDGTVKDNCEDYTFDDGTLKIGKKINYSTTLNGVTLNNWKVFYIDGESTYLIYGDYLPTSAIVESDSLYVSGNYLVDYSPRASFIDILSIKSNWSSLLIGTLNGEIIDYTSSNVSDAMGSPTLELWVNSWNSNNGYKSIYQFEEEVNGCYDAPLTQYYISFINDSSDWNDSLDLSSENGYNNKLYFPYKENIENGSVYGYWLSSASASDCGQMTMVYSDGNLSYRSSEGALRPVIKLPTSVVNPQ